MGIFDLSWFRTNKQKETLNTLKIETQNLKNEILEKQLAKMDEDETSVKKPYKKMKLVNSVLTVVLEDGSILSKPQASADDFNAVRASTTEAQLVTLMYGKEVMEERKKEEKEIEKQQHIYDGAQLITQFPDFEFREQAVYMSGIDRSLPPLLVDKFAEILGRLQRIGSRTLLTPQGIMELAELDPEYSALKKFWLKCCLNPNAQSAEDLYTFLTHHNMKIDRHGNFFAYRRVQKVKGCGNQKLVNAISNAYNKVKAIWKKNPSDFKIKEVNGEYELHKIGTALPGRLIGNLKDLYLNLPNMKENRYTDAHTHTMDYRVGEIASIPRDKCDDNNHINCGAGLHAASKLYDYTGFGDTDILMIINPMDAVSVPLNEVGKLRVSRWFFAMTLEEGERYILDEDDFDVTELGDVFEEKCLANLESHAHKSFTEEVKRHTFTLPQMSDKVIRNIVTTLEDMKAILDQRVIQK